MKDETIHFRIEKRLKEKLEDESKKMNLSLSEYINKKLENKSLVVIEEGKQIYYELNKIGNNLNQIARKLNSTNNNLTLKDKVQLNYISEGINKIWQLLNSLK